MKYIKRHALLIFVLAVVAALGAAVYLSSGSKEEYNEGVVVKEHVKGNPDAQVVLTEYSDLQCPACAQAAPFIAQLVEEFGDEIRFEYRHFPLISIHPLAVSAAQAAEAAGQQDAFFAYHDLLFEHQTVWSRSGNPKGAFMNYANELGLDLELFERHMNAPILKEAVMTQYREAQAGGFRSTPTFLLNGELMQFQSYGDIRDQVVAAIEAAQQ